MIKLKFFVLNLLRSGLKLPGESMGLGRICLNHRKTKALFISIVAEF